MKYFKCPVILFFTIAFFCCKKDEKTVDIDILTTQNWQLIRTLLTVRNPIAPQYNTDSLIYPEACDTSDYLRFFKDSSYIKYNVEKCDVSEQDTNQGSWSYNKRNQYITFFNVSGKEEFQVFELMKSKFVIIQEIKLPVVFKNKKYTIYTKKVFSYKGKLQ